MAGNITVMARMTPTTAIAPPAQPIQAMPGPETTAPPRAVPVPMPRLNKPEKIDMAAAYRLLHERVDYPLHLGVTEAGTPSMGVLKSAIGIGGLLCEGIGDTMRVSLTADPVEEVYAAKRILRACGLRRSGVNLISCPTCGRTAYDMIPLAEELERRLEDCDKPITVAVMGCVVNGPGEASAADIGVAGGKGEGLIFRHGEVLYKVAQEKLLDALLEEIEKL